MDYIALQQWVSKCVHKQKLGTASSVPPVGQEATAAAGDTLPSIDVPADAHL